MSKYFELIVNEWVPGSASVLQTKFRHNYEYLSDAKQEALSYEPPRYELKIYDPNGQVIVGKHSELFGTEETQTYA